MGCVPAYSSAAYVPVFETSSVVGNVNAKRPSWLVAAAYSLEGMLSQQWHCILAQAEPLGKLRANVNNGCHLSTGQPGQVHHLCFLLLCLSNYVVQG